MSQNVFGPTNPVNQNQINQAGDPNALMTAQFSGEVEHTFMEESVLEKFIPRRAVKGTNTLTKKAIGRTKLQRLNRGEAPDGTQVDFSKASITVDTVILSRHSLFDLDVIQTDIDARKEIAIEQGQEIAEFIDQTFCIAGAHAAAQTVSAYSQGSTTGKPEGHFGATQVKMNAAGDENDPAKFYHKIGELVAKMRKKKVNARTAGLILIVDPDQYHVLMDSEQIINGQYLTSDGNKLSDIPQFKAWGIPVVESIHLPQGVISGHYLSNPANNNFYDGDFTGLVALMISPKALLAGESIPLTSKVWYSDAAKCWFVDSWMSFAVGLDRVEYAGRIDKA
ncbi:major capsid protein [Xanthomonas phage SB3]|uniref:Major capsid protein n=1 Tax=Xanthomonas phage SB3 TaxID=3117472 RepID=A0ABZ2GWM9_9CAUD